MAFAIEMLVKGRFMGTIRVQGYDGAAAKLIHTSPDGVAVGQVNGVGLTPSSLRYEGPAPAGRVESAPDTFRSPMQHLTSLRLRRAVHLLSVTDDKVEVIAHTVGFESVFTFSNTFKKWIGWRPSEHRRQTL